MNNPGKICTKCDVTALAYFEVHQGEEGRARRVPPSVFINLFFPVSGGRILPCCLQQPGVSGIAFPFHLPPWPLPARGHPEVSAGRRPWSGIIHLPGLLPSPIFWSVTLWKESVSGAAGTGRQGRIVRDEGEEEIKAGFFPGRKTVCPRIYPKCKLNIPLSTTK